MAYSIDLSGRVALVTGASSGLGEQFAKTLSRAGAAVVLASRRVEKLKELRAEIEAEGGDAHVVALDVTDLDSIKSAVAHAETEVGSIDILVNNSGVSTTQRVQDVTEDDFDFIFNTNVKGSFFVAQEVGKRMLARAKGSAPGTHYQYCVGGWLESVTSNWGVLHEQGRSGSNDQSVGDGVGPFWHQRECDLPRLYRYRNQPPPLEHGARQKAGEHVAPQARRPSARFGCFAGLAC